MWIGLFPSSARSVRFANGRLSFLHPGLRPSCDPFEVLTLGGSSLPLAAGAHDSLGPFPRWGALGRVGWPNLPGECARAVVTLPLPSDGEQREEVPLPGSPR